MSKNNQQPHSENPKNQFSSSKPMTFAQKVEYVKNMKMIESSYLHGFERAHDYKDVKEHILKSVPPIKLQSVTTIELPSDVEIEAHVEDDFLNASEVHKYSEEAQLLMKAMCKAGALWMRDKIQGGDK